MDLCKLHILNLAVVLNSKKSTMTGAQLAADLNTNGFRTSYGTPYESMRDTYILLLSTYEVIERIMGKTHADLIANAFIKPDVNFACH